MVGVLEGLMLLRPFGSEPNAASFLSKSEYNGFPNRRAAWTLRADGSLDPRSRLQA